MLARKQYQASEIATEFLNAQMTAVRNEISEREKELSKLGTEKNILPLTVCGNADGREDGGDQQEPDRSDDRPHQQMEPLQPDQIRPPRGNPGWPAGSFLQKLREEYRTLGREYARRLATLTPEYPEMVRLNGATRYVTRIEEGHLEVTTKGHGLLV